ncbi:MAG: hypothetical protein MRY21_07735 [Simkaniaceae bacterium]|nr:hypothetical protein [Simkaniaceae bacterium]
MDRIVIRCGKKEQLDQLEKFFTRDLKFPLIHQHTVWAGNVAFQMIYAGGGAPQFAAFGYEGYSLEEMEKDLAQSNIHIGKKYSIGTFFDLEWSYFAKIMRALRGLSYELNRGIAIFTVANPSHRSAEFDDLQERSLGVRFIECAALSTRTPLTITNFMNELHSPHAPLMQEEWKLADSPAVKLEPVEIDAITHIELKVRSLNHAKEYLEKQGVMHIGHSDHVEIRPLGLRLLLVE